MSRQPFAPLLVFCAIFLIAPVPASATVVTMAWSPVGNPGNAADPATGSVYGAVDYSFDIGTYDVTTSQYTAFLNAVAASDPYGLYVFTMGTAFPTVGIKRSGSQGGYSYAVIGNGNVPVFDVDWGRAARFVNWLQNGQPSGAEGPGTTETGTYALNGKTVLATRAQGAMFVLPTENEWYKAAYYMGESNNAGYWLYPTQSNSPPSNVLSTTGTDNANFQDTNFSDPENYLTPVGAFAASPGPYGTFDQGGDVAQWTETVVEDSPPVLRGGFWDGPNSNLESSSSEAVYPTYFDATTGFRVAMIPEPPSIALFVVGIVGLAAMTRARSRRAPQS